MMDVTWNKINQSLIAKSIGELAYEQVLHPALVSQPASSKTFNYILELKSGVTYFFAGWKTIWEHLRVQADSVERKSPQGRHAAWDAGQFFIDAQAELEMSDITLANFLEEMQSTLFSDLEISKRYGALTVDELALFTGDELQPLLNGHPKILLNKGRMGWGADDLASYAPESKAPFQLYWIAVHKSKTTYSAREQQDSLFIESLDSDVLGRFQIELKNLGKEQSDYIFIPTHPWQWNRILQIQYAAEIAQKNIIPFGQAGDFYRPQISIRTLSNSSNPLRPDVKLPLSILNTSAVRGISARYLSLAPKVSLVLSNICKTDAIMFNAKTEVLQEFAGLGYQQPQYAQIKEAPYRYHETLGVIWRESVPSKLKLNQKAVLTAALFHQDAFGKSLLSAYIEKSNLSAKEWAARYFDCVVIPLFHLQLKYGIGLVAHGQNIMLKMENFCPVGMFIKDFQGDLRVSKDFFEQGRLQPEISHLDKLPPDYLIHDLLTGHLLTVLRFVSAALQENDVMKEDLFYQVLAERIQNYLNENKVVNNDSRISLLNPKVHRVLLNKVRFKIGYADNATRPRPLLGTELQNPLVLGGQHE